MTNEKQNKWILIIIFLCIIIGTRFIAAYARQSPKEVRRPLIILNMALLMSPIGFICGRNSAKKDKTSKDRWSLFAIMILLLFIGSTFGGILRLFIGVGVGFFAGFLIGRLVLKKTTEKYGDSPEADQILNIYSTPKEKPSETYLKNLDQPARRMIKKLEFIEAFSISFGMLLAFMFAFTNHLYNICCRMHVHSGDGTLYFINSDPMIIAFQLIIIFSTVFGMLGELLQPIIAGNKLDIWKEYRKIRDAKSKLFYKYGKICLVVCIIASIISIFLYFDSYLKVTPDGVEYNRFFGLGAKFYRWNDIKSVDYYQKNYAKSKYDKKRYWFYAEITFNDGTKWKTDHEDKRREKLFQEGVYYIASRKK